MSLLTEASLVITPNAVEEGKLFSIIPTDGSGDLTVVRATTATRVNSDGLIEEVPYNLLQRSEELNVSPWINIAVTTNASAVLSPSNSNSYKIIPNTTNTNHYILQNISVVSGTTYTFSFFAKADGYNFTSTFISALGIVANWDLQNGTASAGASIVNYGNGWYRCIVSGTAVTTGASSIRIYAQETSISAFSGNGVDGVLAWGAQLVKGTEPKEYFPTTDRLDVPRLDYTNGGCPSILVEPQRTNLITQSELLSLAFPSKAGSTITDNYGVSPSGQSNSSRIQFANTTSFCYGVVSISTDHTASVYVKGASGETVRFGIGGNVTTGTLFTFNGLWQRIEYTTSSATQIFFSSYSGATATDFEAFGLQLEAGSNATSYIPTVGSSVTRNADVISKTGISDLIGQTEGTIYAECNFKNANASAKYISVNNGTNNNRISFVLQGNGTLLILEMAINGTVLANVVLKNLSNLNLFLKIALKYKSGEIKCFVDGQLLFSNNLTYSNAILDRLLLTNPTGGQRFDGNINSIQLYKTALTDEQCIALTTL
jgi:hypothetical protein